MKRPEATKPVKGTWKCGDSAFAKRYPTLARMLCDAFWDDGKSRECSSFSVRMDQTSVFVSISDHAMQASLFTTAATLEEGLALAEQAIASDTGQWRPWKGGPKK
jgi:hypothetical protein